MAVCLRIVTTAELSRTKVFVVYTHKARSNKNIASKKICFKTSLTSTHVGRKIR